jgi:hypothetical protein
MTSFQVQFEVLRHSRRIGVLSGCAEHQFSDVSRDPKRRLRTGEVQCHRCGQIVSVLCAFLYLQGRRHGPLPAEASER